MIFATLMAFAVSAQAGVLLVQKTEPVQGSGATTTSKVLVDRDRVRVDADGSQQQHIFIYQADRQTMYMIDPEKKTYQEMTKQELEQMMGQLGDQMAQMKKMMDEQMKNMPPQQRQMMEQMMKGKMKGLSALGPAGKTLYRKVSSGQQVGRWTCDKYEGHSNNKKVEDVWTTDWNQFGVSADDFRVFQELADTFKSLGSRVGASFFQVGTEGAQTEEQYSGVPVRRISYLNGKPHQKHEITQVSRQNFEDSLFEVPQGYRKSKSSWKANVQRLDRAKTPARAPSPQRKVEKLDCAEAIRRFRAGQATADVVNQSCPAEIAGAIVAPATGPGSPSAAPVAANPATAPTSAFAAPGGATNLEPYFSSEPTILQGGTPLRLSANRIIRTAVRTAQSTAIDALKDYAVRKAIQTGIEKAVQQAAVRSAAGSFGGIGGSAVSGLSGFGRRRTKPGFQFVVMETAKASIRAAAGEAVFLVPSRYRNTRLVRMTSQEGFRLLESRKGRVRGDGQFRKPEGAPVQEEILLNLVQTTSKGMAYQPAQPLQPGEHYALVGDEPDTAFDFSVGK
jgi:hypothetical protein